MEVDCGQSAKAAPHLIDLQGMKMKYLILLPLLNIASIVGAASLPPAAEETQHWAYENLPGEGGSVNGSISGRAISGVGDSNSIPLRRTSLVMSFATNDLWRSKASQGDAIITLNIEIESVKNGGAPSEIKLALLDVGRDLGSTNSSGFAWLLAPTFFDYGNVVSPDVIGVVQSFDVTDKIKEHLGELNFQESGICFAFYTPVPSDNGIENTSLINTATASLAVSTDSTPSPEIEIENAILIQFETAPGYYYFVEYSSDLSQWTREPKGIQGNGEVHRKFYPVSDSRKFYRVVTIE